MERLNMVLREDGSNLWDWLTDDGVLVEWDGPPLVVTSSGFRVTDASVVRTQTNWRPGRSWRANL